MTRTLTIYGRGTRTSASAKWDLLPVDRLLWQLRAVTPDHFPEPVREHRFHPSRRWRFDLAWPAHLVAVEVDGGGFVGGRHGTGKGMRDDAEKYSAAAGLGWRIVRVVPDQIDSGEAVKWVLDALAWKP